MRELLVAELGIPAGGWLDYRSPETFRTPDGDIQSATLPLWQTLEGSGGANGVLVRDGVETEVFVGPDGSVWDSEASYAANQANQQVCEGWVGVMAYGGTWVVGGAAATALGGTGAPIAVIGGVIAGVGGVGGWVNGCF